MTTSMFVLNWISRSRVSVTGPCADAGELDAVALLERRRQRDEVVGVHLHRVRMARVAHELVARARNLAVDRAGQ